METIGCSRGELAVKCTEKEFTPFYAKCVEWAKARAAEKDTARWRLSALFRLTSALADQLRAVFRTIL